MTVNASVKTELLNRAGSRCEFCGAESDLDGSVVAPRDESADSCVLLCGTCSAQLQTPKSLDVNHWRCLSDAIWNETGSVKVLAWRILNCLKEHAWASELLEQIYLDEEQQEWASSVPLIGADDSSDEVSDKPTVDSNGAVLANGDAVCIIKDLNVKGTTFTAKRGTIVRNIRLTNNPEHVEGRVNGTVIVLKTCFLKKST
ncbi:MAG: PhnA domain-containing protein [Planctomycetaceae bacterium]